MKQLQHSYTLMSSILFDIPYKVVKGSTGYLQEHLLQNHLHPDRFQQLYLFSCHKTNHTDEKTNTFMRNYHNKEKDSWRYLFKSPATVP